MKADSFHSGLIEDTVLAHRIIERATTDGLKDLIYTPSWCVANSRNWSILLWTFCTVFFPGFFGDPSYLVPLGLAKVSFVKTTPWQVRLLKK